MKKMLVTIMVQKEIEYDELNEDSYDEELNELISDLEDLNLTVSVESEESDEDEDEDLEEDY